MCFCVRILVIDFFLLFGIESQLFLNILYKGHPSDNADKYYFTFSQFEFEENSIEYESSFEQNSIKIEFSKQLPFNRFSSDSNNITICSNRSIFSLICF